MVTTLDELETKYNTLFDMLDKRRDQVIAFKEFLDRFGDDILMFHVGNRDIGAQHARDFAGKTTGGVDNMFGSHRSLFGDDFEFTGRHLVDIEHPVVTHDVCAHVTRPFCQGVAAAGRIDVAIIQCPGPGQYAGGIDMGEDFIDLVRTDDLHAKADHF